MANNRMYLVNKRTGAKVYLAKYYPSTGWYIPKPGLEQRLADAFDQADFGHLTDEQRKANDSHVGLGVPHQSSGGMYGDEWTLEYEVQS